MKKILLSILLLGFITAGCTKYYSPEPYFEEYEQDNDDDSVKRKILFISIDGLVGQEIQREIPENIKLMMNNSKFTFESMSDINTSDAASWATLVNGVSSSVHHITSDSYLPSPDPNHPHDPTDFSPSLLYMIKELNSKLYTIAVTQNAELSNVLLMDSKESFTVHSDVEEKTKLIDILSEENPDLLIGQFTSVLNAGKASSFSFDSPEYKNAVKDVDSYIGEIKKAIESRESYDKEDWLIILTSTHGGVDNTYGGNSFTERNTFSLLYNKNLKSLELDPSLINATTIYQTGGTEATLNGPILRSTSTSDYNFDGTEMTIEFKLKKNVVHPWTGQPFFLGKTARRYSQEGGIGWGFATQGTSITFYYIFDDNNSGEIQFPGIANNLLWQHYAVTIKRDGNNVIISAYLNGETPIVKTISRGSLALAKMTSPAALYLGVQRSHNANVLNKEELSVSDLRIYNSALPQAQVKELACLINDVPSSFASFSNLVANYNLTGLVNGNTITNMITGKPNLTTQNAFPLYFGTTNILTACDDPTSSNKILVKSVDFATTILYWLNLQPKDAWKLEGVNFLSNFELEFIK